MRLPGLQTDTEGEVTPSDFNKAALAIFAAKAAGPGASFEQMKGICCCIRNRVREGWGEWLDVIEAAEDDKANLPGPRVRLDTENKSLRRLMQEIDDIYYGGGSHQILGPGSEEGTLEDALERAVFWAFVNQPFQPWFVENVIHRPDNFPEVATMATMIFYGVPLKTKR